MKSFIIIYEPIATPGSWKADRIVRVTASNSETALQWVQRHRKADFKELVRIICEDSIESL